MKKQDVKPSSLYLKLILEQSGYFSRISKSTGDKDMKQHMPPVSRKLMEGGREGKRERVREGGGDEREGREDERGGRERERE
jgi:hypothetical protein